MTVLMVGISTRNTSQVIYFQDCPCNINCPGGCNDCSNPICVCGENSSSQNEDNLQECMKEKSINLGQCIIDCNGDQSCEDSCVNLFKVQYDQCPCQVKKVVLIPIFTQHEFFRTIVRLDAHAIYMIANRTKKLS